MDDEEAKGARSDFRPLLLAASEDERKAWKAVSKVPKHAAEFDKLLGDKQTQTYDKFAEGGRKDHYNAVVIPVLGDETAADDLEMQEEFYQHYGAAPVTAWVCRDDLEDGLKSLVSGGHKVFKFAGTEDEAKAGAALQAVQWAKAEYEAKARDDVKKAFDKFDTDKSGEIDREELANLSKELGFELTEDEQDAALKDLDLNNDGVIDFNEFARWYFTGMKPYNGGKRTMLQVCAKSASIFGALSHKTLDALGGDLKTKQHKLAVSFNKPANPQTKVEYGMHFVGSRYLEAKEELNIYEGTHSLENAMKGPGMSWMSPEEMALITTQASIGLKDAAAAARLAEKAGALITKARETLVPEEHRCTIPNPKVQASGNKLVIGSQMCAPYDRLFPNGRALQKLKVPDEIQQLVSHIDQHIKVRSSVASSYDDLYESQDPMIEQLVKGFAVEVEVQLISNVKKAIMEVLKEDESQAIAQALMMAGPAFMVGVSGSLDIEFDDFDEIKEHPMAAPALVNFSDLFEGMVGSSKEEALAVLEKKGDVEKALAEAPAEGDDAKKLALEALLLGLDLVENLGEDGLFETKTLLPDRGFVETKIQAPGLHKAAKLGYAMGPFKLLLRELGVTDDAY